MKPSSTTRGRWNIYVATLFAWALVRAGNGAAPDLVPPSDQSSAVFQEMVPALQVLDKLARQFDADHDHTLSPPE